MTATISERYAGCLLGLACGDAVGTTVEFSPRGTFEPLTDMVGGGPFKLKPGQWTDDTSMALCLGESLLSKGEFDANDQMVRYLNWWQWGYLSSTGECFDIGGTVREALEQFQRDGVGFSGSTRPSSAGNGSLMRLAPVVLYFHPDSADVDRYAVDSSRTTHAAPEAIECCQLFAELICKALAGQSKAQIVAPSSTVFSEPKVKAIAAGGYLHKPRDQIRGTGYCIDSLEAALWSFATTSSFEAAVLAAANLGDDADTTAAITGQLAGAFYGKSGIPKGWLANLYMRDDIEQMAEALLAAGAIPGNDYRSTVSGNRSSLISKYRCAEYLESTYAEDGYWDETGQFWLIEPAANIEEHSENPFLQIGRPGVDGIGFGYRAGLEGLWAYYPIDDEFEYKAATLSELVEGWERGAISV